MGQDRPLRICLRQQSLPGGQMRSEVAIAVIALGIGSTAFAQSPPAKATGSIGGKTVTVQYSAPSVRGRRIFGDGGLLSRDPTYPYWRAGANAATTFKT